MEARRGSRLRRGRKRRGGFGDGLEDAPAVAGDGRGEDSAGGRPGASRRVIDPANAVADEVLVRGQGRETGAMR